MAAKICNLPNYTVTMHICTLFDVGYNQLDNAMWFLKFEAGLTKFEEYGRK